jgi:hypothetical protein
LLESEDISSLASLEQEVAKMMEKGDLDFSKGKGAKELFIIFLYMYAQYKAKEPSKGFMALIMEILKQA